VDEYLMSRPCDYFYKSIVFLLFDILLWFKLFLDGHQNVEENKVLWEPIIKNEYQTPMIGEIKQDANGNYYYKDAIFAYLQIHGKCEIGSKVKVIEIIENTKSTKNDYPNFISKFQIIS